MSKLKKVVTVLIKIVVVMFALIGLTSTVVVVGVLRTPKEVLAAITTYQLIKSNFYEDVDQQKLMEGISKGLAGSLEDRYSVYYTKAEVEEFNSQLNRTYAGIGIVFGYDKEGSYVKVIRVFKDFAAYKAGLLPGDIIVEINGDSTEDMNTDTIAKNVKGEPGTSVDLRIFRNGKYLEFTVVRENIQAPSVIYEVLDDGILYVEISTFGDTTAQEFRNMLDSLEEKPEKIVLDLRNNVGGLLNQAVDLARYFIPGGVVLYESGRDDDKLIPFSVDNSLYLNIPVAVLVNENSASASEVLSGAMQDYKTGTLIGTNTFGKAVVQSLYPLPTGGALKLTTQRYLTPLKRDLSKDGLTPDIEVKMTDEDYQKIDYSSLLDIEHDLQLKRAIEFLLEK